MDYKQLIKILAFCSLSLCIAGCSGTKKEATKQPATSTTQKKALTTEPKKERFDIPVKFHAKAKDKNSVLLTVELVLSQYETKKITDKKENVTYEVIDNKTQKVLNSQVIYQYFDGGYAQTDSFETTIPKDIWKKDRIDVKAIYEKGADFEEHMNVNGI